MRWALGLALALAACGGGAPGLALAPSLDLSAPGTIRAFPDTGAPGDRTTVTFTVNAPGFAACGNGHAGVMLHADLARIPGGPYAGAGVIFGTQLPGHLAPVIVPESWAGAAQATPPLLWPASSAMPGDTFTLSVLSERTPAGNELSYAVNGERSAVTLDPNAVVDMGEGALAFFNAAGTPACPYSLTISAPTVTH